MTVNEWVMDVLDEYWEHFEVPMEWVIMSRKASSYCIAKGTTAREVRRDLESKGVLRTILNSNAKTYIMPQREWERASDKRRSQLVRMCEGVPKKKTSEREEELLRAEFAERVRRKKLERGMTLEEGE